MINYSVKEISHIIHGEIFNNPNQKKDIKFIGIDSRTIVNGENTIYFALTGVRNDGHNYLESVAKKNICAVVVSQLPKNPGLFKNIVIIKVENTLNALHELATFHRKRFNYPVIGITGSNGKTIIKEWLYELLNSHFSIIRSPKSYNSQVGVPLSVWLMNQRYNLAIFEAGISLPGEMGNLEKMISPDIGVFTNIGLAHQENFTDINQKIIEKLILFRNSKILVYSADQKEIAAIVEKFCGKYGIKKIVWSLNDEPASIQFHAIINHSSTNITTRMDDNVYTFSIPFTDSSAIENACHCFAAIFATGVPVNEIIEKFKRLETIAMRLEIKQGKNNCVLINDYYNSDINALSIALTTLKNQALKGHLKKVLILSDIKQSGINPEELYTWVNKMAENAGVNLFIGIGSDLWSAQNIFRPEKYFFRDTDSLVRQFDFSILKDSTILIKGAREFNFEKVSSALQEKAHQTVLEIDMNAMIDNLNSYRSLLKSGTKIMAMVKAFSYGSGTVEIATLLQFHGISYLAVAVADEGVELRKSGISTPIIVMNPESDSFQNMFDYKLEPNIYDLNLLNNFSKAARFNALVNFPIHIKIDTGMNRLGFKTKDELKQGTVFLKEAGTLKINSVFSHLAASDDPGFDSFTINQFEQFNFLSSEIISSFDYKIDRHILNSAGIERFGEYQFEMVRLGIGLYGISSTGLKLKNISTLKTTISQIKEVDHEETIGYSRKGQVTKLSRIAIIPIGYADGLRRNLGNLNGRVFINGSYAPLIGNICMDMCMADVSGIETKPGDTVEIFGPHIPITELADKAGTIPYEILTGISQRVKRVYLQE